MIASVAPFAAVIRQDAFAAELDRLARTEWAWGALRRVRHRMLKTHRERCTFELVVETAQGSHVLIAKVYAEDQAHVFDGMRAVRDAGFDRSATLSIAQPLAYLPGLRVLLVEALVGSSALDVFLGDDPRVGATAAERCAEWLGRFHAVAPCRGARLDPRGALRRFRAWVEQIERFGEPFAAKSTELLERLERCAPASNAGEPRAGHGSYIPEHVILGAGRTATFDLDELDVADPARDVAWFIVSLERRALTLRGALTAFDPLVARFASAYRTVSSPRATAHVPFYRAAECLHRARRDLVKRVPPVPAWAEIMLDQGTRLLA